MRRVLCSFDCQQQLTDEQMQAAAHLQVAEQRLRLDVEHLRAVVHHLGVGALHVRSCVDVLVEVLQQGQV